jgi:hypothetical protein
MGSEEFLRLVMAAARRVWPSLTPEELVIRFQGGKEFRSPIDPAHLRDNQEKGKAASLSGIKRSVLQVLETTRKRHHLSDVFDALRAKRIRASERQIERVLGQLQDKGIIDNDRDDRGDGYGLVAWSR